jgi:hypothetical protein
VADRDWKPPEAYRWWNSREYVALCWLRERFPTSDVLRSHLEGLCTHMEYHADFYCEELPICKMFTTFLEAAPTIARTVRRPEDQKRCMTFGSAVLSRRSVPHEDSIFVERLASLGSSPPPEQIS